jgi:curved DNA-binding protein CbpA
MINSRNTLKTAVGAATICTVATAAVSSGSIHSSSLLHNAILSPRGGDSTVNSTSIPVNNTSSYKKRTSRKSPKKPLNQESHENEKSDTKAFMSAKTTGEESQKTDPILEDLLKQQDFYAILGVSKTATSSQIQKAYRKRAVITHPDKTGGDRRAFDKVSEAYDVLSDDTKRSIYDRFGKKGLQQHQTGGFPSSRSAEDIFRHFFGQHAHVPRNRTVRYQLEVTLEDLYQGLTRSILVEQPNGRKKIQVHVPRGYSSGEAIILSGEMDAHADSTPGDLIFLLQQRPHDRFVRKGHDLALHVTITL